MKSDTKIILGGLLFSQALELLRKIPQPQGSQSGGSDSLEKRIDSFPEEVVLEIRKTFDSEISS